MSGWPGFFCGCRCSAGRPSAARSLRCEVASCAGLRTLMGEQRRVSVGARQLSMRSAKLSVSFGQRRTTRRGTAAGAAALPDLLATTKRGAAVGRQRRGHLFRAGLPSVRFYFPVAPEHWTHRAGSLLSRSGPHSVSGPGAPVRQDHFCRPAGPQHLLLSFGCWDQPATAAASVVPEPAAPRARGSKQGNWSSHSYWLSLSTVQEERDLTSTSSDQGSRLTALRSRLP